MSDKEICQYIYLKINRKMSHFSDIENKRTLTRNLSIEFAYVEPSRQAHRFLLTDEILRIFHD